MHTSQGGAREPKTTLASLARGHFIQGIGNLGQQGNQRLEWKANITPRTGGTKGKAGVSGPRNWGHSGQCSAHVGASLRELGPWREVLSGLEPQRRHSLCQGPPADMASEEQDASLSLPPAFWRPASASHWPNPDGSLLRGNVDHGGAWGMGSEGNLPAGLHRGPSG